LLTLRHTLDARVEAARQLRLQQMDAEITRGDKDKATDN
jgi:hypothetical protein